MSKGSSVVYLALQMVNSCWERAGFTPLDLVLLLAPYCQNAMKYQEYLKQGRVMLGQVEQLYFTGPEEWQQIPQNPGSMFYQTEARAEKALALFETRQVSFGEGNVKKCWSAEHNGVRWCYTCHNGAIGAIMPDRALNVNMITLSLIWYSISIQCNRYSKGSYVPTQTPQSADVQTHFVAAAVSGSGLWVGLHRVSCSKQA